MRNGPRAVIAGGGVIGLAIARELHLRGLCDITILEKGLCGQEASWAAAGMLSPQVEADKSDDLFSFCCSSRDMYPRFAEELFDETSIDIEFDRSGTLAVAFDEKRSVELVRRSEFQRDLGLSVEQLTGDEVRRLEPNLSRGVTSGLSFPGDWQVENRRLVAALRRYAELNAIGIREGVAVESVEIDGSRVTGVRTADGILSADLTILATGAWTSLIKIGADEMAFKVEPVRGQIVSYAGGQSSRVKRVIWGPDGYLVPRRDGRILAGSTTERVGFDSKVTDAARNGLSAMAERLVPALSDADVIGHWAGLRPRAADDLPILGGLNGLDGLTIATAHYRNGILLAPATARAVADEIAGIERSPYLEMFSADRFSIRGVGRAV